MKENMLTIRTVENIKRGSKITLFNGLYAMVYGIISLCLMDIFIKRDFRDISVVWQVFAKYNPEIANMLFRFIIIKSILIIIVGIMIIALSNYILKKKDKTAWVTLFVTGLMFWGSLLTVDIMQGNLITIIISLVGWIMFIIGILLPVRYYLQRDYTEY